jgi:hypothetical protein
VLDDVGTTGFKSATVVRLARDAGLRRAEVLNIWQRSPSLPALTAIGAAYSHLIYWPVPSFTEEECQKTGPCAEGWQLIGGNS